MQTIGTAVIWGTALTLCQIVALKIFPDGAGTIAIGVLASAVWPALWYWRHLRSPAASARRESQRNQRAYCEFVEASLDAVLELDQQGTVLRMNSAAVTLFGVDTGKKNQCHTPANGAIHASELFDWPLQQHWCDTASPLRADVLGHRRDGSVFSAEITCTPLRDDNSGATTYCVHVRDLSGQHYPTRAGNLLRTCIDYIDDAIIVTESAPLDEPGPRVIYVNKAIEHMTGYSQEQLLGKSPRLLQGPETDPKALKRLRHALEAQQPAHEEFINYTKDGQPFCMEMRIVHVPPVISGGLSYYVGIGRDVTIQREQQRRLQQSEDSLRRLNRELQTVREEERARISRDLHDDLGQILTATKLELGLLLGDAEPPTPAHSKKLRRLIEMTDGAVDRIRDIAANLRPSLLDHLGFVAAAQWCVKDAGQRLKAEVNFQPGPGSSLPLNGEVAIALYRILQEALTNISRHAHAHNVIVEYSAPNNRPRLLVCDDGRGFDPAGIKATGSLGLLGLRERVESLGGEFTIDSAPGHGCTLIIQLPEQNEENPGDHRR